MGLRLKMRRLVIIAIILVVIGLVWFRISWSRRINYWEVVNPAPTSQVVLCFGDSLVAGVGADGQDGGYPVQLGKMLGREVVVAGVPGETAADGLKRLQKARGGAFGIVVVTLGGNDILKRVPWEETRGSLEALFREFQGRGALVVFTVVEGPFGGREKRYRQLCREAGVLVVPDIFEGILGDPGFMSDQIHPNNEGYRLVAEKVAAVIRQHFQNQASL